MEVPNDEVSRYGVIDPDPDAATRDDRLYRVTAAGREAGSECSAEQPGDHRPLRADAQDLRNARVDPRGAGGEIQLTDAIEALITEQDVYGYEFEGRRFDAGTTMGWLQASVELALERPDLGADFRQFLAGLDLS